MCLVLFGPKPGPNNPPIAMNSKANPTISSRIANLCASLATVSDNYALILSALVLIFICLGSTSRGQQPRRGTQKPRLRVSAIHAIHTLITPNQGSFWPMRYREWAARSDASRSDKIVLPVHHILLDFISDTIEIRGYEASFPDSKFRCFSCSLIFLIE